MKTITRTCLAMALACALPTPAKVVPGKKRVVRKAVSGNDAPF